MVAYVYKRLVEYSRYESPGPKLLLPGIFSESGILISHLRYLYRNGHKSPSWKERSAFSIVLLIKYINANIDQFHKAQDLLRAFVESLSVGSIDPFTGDDSSNLFWPARTSTSVRQLLFHITDYTDYLNALGDGNKIMNPLRKASCTEERLNVCAYYQKKSKVFLNHLNGDNKNIDVVRDVRSRVTPMFSVENVVRFPEDKVDDLLTKGFVFTRKQMLFGETNYDYKCQAITILMHFGGLRRSEVFQLYLSDILVDDKRNEAIVRVFHPSDGNSPDPKFNNRRAYLQECFGLIPRTEYPVSNRQHCGWKNPLLTDKRGFFQVVFAPPEKAKDFLLAWGNYLKYQRIDCPDDFFHPYAFTNSKGHPETIKNFQRLHHAAVERIGLEVAKYLGTSDHGHRHAFGFRLQSYGLSQIEIQKAMHHKSPDSCLVYIQPTNEEIRKKMRATEQ